MVEDSHHGKSMSEYGGSCALCLIILIIDTVEKGRTLSTSRLSDLGVTSVCWLILCKSARPHCGGKN